MIRLAVRVAAADAEIVLAELLELAPGGVEEVELEGGARVEYAVYGSPGELPAIGDLQAVVGATPVEISGSEVAEDWAERWKLHHRPVLVSSPRPEAAPDLWVRPPWEDSRAQAGAALEVVIDPGQAFGTGAHASTRLCLELLLALAASEPASEAWALDVGTGSGVLAIAAAKLGYAPVLGIDHDRESVRAAMQNAEANGVRIEVARVDLRSDQLPVEDPERPTVLLANLLRPLLLDLAVALPAAPSHLLAGGLLRGEVAEIVDAYGERWGMRERERRESGDWAAVWLQAGSSGA
jgi:ribosomal protein L11 methyltransferase